MMTRQNTAQFLYRLRVGYLITTNIIAVLGLGVVLNLMQHRFETPRTTAVMAEGMSADRLASAQSAGSDLSNRDASIASEPTPTLRKNVIVGTTAITQNRLDQSTPHLTATPRSNNSSMPSQTAVSTATVTPTKVQPTATATPAEIPPFPTVVLANISSATPIPTAIVPSPTPTATPRPSQTPLPSPTPWPSEPGVLSVPKLNLLQQVQQVPIRDGNWDIGNLGEDVGLLQSTGRHPNDRLSMTFVGHVTTVWPLGGPFERLGHLSLGDIVQYQVGSQLYTYEITRFLRVDPSRGDLLINERGDQILLVTCDGYSLLTDEFNNRLIAQATLMQTETVAMPEEIGK